MADDGLRAGRYVFFYVIHMWVTSIRALDNRLMTVSTHVNVNRKYIQHIRDNQKCYEVSRN